MSDYTHTIRIYGPLSDLNDVLEGIENTGIGNIEWAVDTVRRNGELSTEIYAVGYNEDFEAVGEILIEASKKSGCICEHHSFTADEGPFTRFSRYAAGVEEELFNNDLLFCDLNLAITARQALDGDRKSADALSGEFAATRLDACSWSVDIFSMLSLVSLLHTIDYYPSPEHAEGWLACIESIQETEEWDDMGWESYFENVEDGLEMLESRAQAILIAENSRRRLAATFRNADSQLSCEVLQRNGEMDAVAANSKHACAL